MTGAAAAGRDHTGRVLGAPRLSAGIHPAATPSPRVAERTGRRHEGESAQRVRRYAADLVFAADRTGR